MSLPIPMSSSLPEVYAAGASGAFGSVPMDFSAPAEDPDTLWMSISDAVRKRARERSGPILAWWAYREHGKPAAGAVVLGENELVTVEPIAEGAKTVYRVSGVALAPHSFRSFEVSASANRAAQPAAEEPAMPFEGQMELLVRNLPGQAQRHLQAPYHDGSSLVRYGSFYLKWERPLGTELQVWAYAFGTSRLVFVSGGRFTRHGEPEELGIWQLTCRSAAIAS